MDYKKISKIIAGTLLCTMALYTTPVLAYTKDETVYSKLSIDGNKYETIVSTHLKNTENEELIKDMTNLLNIKNTNGDETFKQNDNSIIWDAQKHDIYYQGNTEKELPIEVSVEYKLNGEVIEPKDIVGKSGEVAVTVRYTNKDEHEVNINGRREKIYTPFVIVAGTIIDNSKNRNITVTNGKVIDDGSKTIVLGMALPGLKESLKLSSNQIDIPNSVEISMEATDFEMSSIMNFVTPKVLEKEDISFLNNIKDMYQQVNTLSNSSKQIVDGANTLKQGTQEYSEKMQEFESAMGQVSNGMSIVNSNYSKINEGIKTLNTNSNNLNSGAKQVSDGIEQIETNLNTINNKLEEILSGSENLQSAEAEIIDGIDLIITKLNQITLTDNLEKITELEKLIKTNDEMIKSLTNANINLQVELNNIVEDTEQKEIIKSQINTNKSIIDLLTANTEVQRKTIETLKATDNSAIYELKQGLIQVKTGLNSLSKGTETLNYGITSLKSGTNVLAEKTGELSTGANSLYQGTNKLSVATNTLKDGSEEMYTLDNSGTSLLQANLQLTQGANTINDGATTLAEGIRIFDEEGIEKICNYINGDVKGITERIEKLVELSKEYNNFTILEDGTKGNVKFVMIIDEIKKKEEQNRTEDIIIDDKNKLNNSEQ